MPTIGIGAGGGCDGQVLVLHDLLGLEDRVTPKFVRRYASLEADGVAAVATFASDVREGRFPNDDESYHLSDDVADVLGLYAAARCERAMRRAALVVAVLLLAACSSSDDGSDRRDHRAANAAPAITSTAPAVDAGRLRHDQRDDPRCERRDP